MGRTGSCVVTVATRLPSCRQVSRSELCMWSALSVSVDLRAGADDEPESVQIVLATGCAVPAWAEPEIDLVHVVLGGGCQQFQQP